MRRHALGGRHKLRQRRGSCCLCRLETLQGPDPLLWHSVTAACHLQQAQVCSKSTVSLQQNLPSHLWGRSGVVCARLQSDRHPRQVVDPQGTAERKNMAAAFLQVAGWCEIFWAKRHDVASGTECWCSHAELVKGFKSMLPCPGCAVCTQWLSRPALQPPECPLWPLWLAGLAASHLRPRPCTREAHQQHTSSARGPAHDICRLKRQC